METLADKVHKQREHNPQHYATFQKIIPTQVTVQSKKKRLAVLYFTGHKLSPKPACFLLLRFICHQSCLQYLVSHRLLTARSVFLLMQHGPQ